MMMFYVIRFSFSTLLADNKSCGMQQPAHFETPNKIKMVFNHLSLLLLVENENKMLFGK